MRNKKVLVLGDDYSGVAEAIKALEGMNKSSCMKFIANETVHNKYSDLFSESIEVVNPVIFDDLELTDIDSDLPPKKDFNHPNKKSLKDTCNFITESKRAELRKKRKKRRR